MKTTTKERRRPRLENWAEVIEIATIVGKIENRESLTSAERRLAVGALKTFIGDQKNDRYWQNSTGRPADQTRAFRSVLAIVIDVAGGIEEAAAKAAAGIEWSLSKNQVKHAMKRHRKACEKLIAGKDLAAWRRMNSWHLERLKGKK